MSKNKKSKYIFVIGGVMSGIGKGVTSSSIGTILSHYNYNVNLMKIDPYLNVDAGNMNPTEHGEVFILNSGLETDQDMGNYERFLDRDLYNEDYLTSGMVYKEVIERERALKYKGKCVEAIPHIVNLIIEKIEKSAKASKAEIQIIEIGGTLGDYQNLLFLEAARRMKMKAQEDVLVILVSYVPFPKTIGEVKTRPTQNALHLLNSYGLQASVLIARSDVPLDKKYKEKIATASNLKVSNIISAPDIESIYEAVCNFEKDGISKILFKELNLPKRKTVGILPRWKKFSDSVICRDCKTIKIGIVGKYFATGSFTLSDSYISVIEAIKFSAAKEKIKPEIIWLKSSEFEGRINKKSMDKLNELDGIIIPGGFGSNGVNGKLNVIKIARENKIPTLGICYGMQLMTVEFARNVLGKKQAHTTEVNSKTKDPVIIMLEEQKRNVIKKEYGGTMRLGIYTANLKPGSLIQKLYDEKKVDERHRHRYEFNEKYTKMFEKAGFQISALSNKGLAEVVELDKTKHPFFLGTQFHPEFTARPFDPSPVFNGLIQAAIKKRHKK